MWKICYCFQLQKFSLLHNHILVESIFQEDFISIFSKISPAVYTFAVHATNGKIDETVLYDRTKDPYQMDNIAGQSPRLVRQFNKQLKAWLLHTNDSFAHNLETVTK